jgi:hypothetical protein
VGLFTVAQDSVEFPEGAPAEYQSSPQVRRGFCAKCGTSLTYWHAGWPHDMSFTIASLDCPELMAPVDHTGMADAVPWDVPGDRLPQRSEV